MSEKRASGSRSNKKPFRDSQRVPGDVEVYMFEHPKKSESAFYSLKHTGMEAEEEFPVDVGVILNEKVIEDLLASRAARNDGGTEKKKSSAKKKVQSSQVKSLKETLNRIARYNNKRKEEERFGFASTLFTNAEEIGVLNTVKFLLKAIRHLVAFFPINRQTI
eukprot:TRINITY_DN16117_c0_g3_i1.p1 TRINITY_DN16117_c0_g3~~TRINITY_DN16117_c0_g3_i1.p1  ORF type:complete len:163 (-),score=51.78 TRINITY_DN16117_c0_g3_i1:300-788(-)